MKGLKLPKKKYISMEPIDVEGYISKKDVEGFIDNDSDEGKVDTDNDMGESKQLPSRTLKLPKMGMKAMMPEGSNPKTMGMDFSSKPNKMGQDFSGGAKSIQIDFAPMVKKLNENQFNSMPQKIKVDESPVRDYLKKKGGY